MGLNVLRGIKYFLKKYIMPHLVTMAVKLCVNKFVFLKGNLENIERDKPLILFYPNCGWNTVEQNLPGMFYLKKNFDVFLVTVLPDDEIYRQAVVNRPMMRILQDSSDVVMCYQGDNVFFSRFHSYKMGVCKYLYHKYFDNLFICVIVRSWAYSWRCDYFYENHPETKHIGVGHGACYATYDGPIYYQEWPFFEADKWLFPDKYAYRGTSERILASSVVIGAPIYDLWWRNTLKEIYASEMEAFALSEDKVILIFVPDLTEKERFSEDLKNILKNFIKEYSSSNTLILKFHPRETQQSIVKFFQGFDKKTKMSNVHYSSVPAVVLSTLADCAISFAWTTAAIDAIVNDIPVIEVNEGKQYFGDGSEIECYFIKDNEYGSFYRKNNLTFYARTYDDLCNAIHGVLYNNMWDGRKKKYKEFFRIDNCASERMAKEIMQLVQTNKVGNIIGTDG